MLVLGNVVHQGPRADNSTLVSFAAEGATNPQQGLFIAYNSFVDSLGGGPSCATCPARRRWW